MKKAVFAVFAALAASLASFGQSSPAVTQREMVRYVGGVSNALENSGAERLASVSNYFDSVTPAGLSNRVQKVIDGAAFVSNYYFVVEGELVALSNFVGDVSPAGLSNYVDKVNQSIINSLIATTEENDELVAVDGHTLMMTVRQLIDGVITNVPYFHDVEVVSEKGTNKMFQVYDSNCADRPNGMLMSVAEDAWGSAVLLMPTNTFLTFYNGRRVKKSDYAEGEIYWWGRDVYTLLGYWYDHSTVAEFTDSRGETISNAYQTAKIDIYQMNDTGSVYRVTESAVLYSVDTNGFWVVEDEQTNCVYYLRTYLGSDEQWRANIPNDGRVFRKCGYPFDHGEYDDVETRQFNDAYLSIVPREERLSAARKKKARMFPALKAIDPLKVNIPTYPDAPHGCVKVNSYEYWNYDPDEYVASPETCWKVEDWNKVENWVDIPEGKGIQVNVPYQDKVSGEWSTKSRMIKSYDSLKKLLAEHPHSGIPPDYPMPSFDEIKDCDDLGHIWGYKGDGCQCIVCGTTRPHNFEQIDANMCDRCSNKYSGKERTTKAKKALDGNKWAPTGVETDQMCLKKCESNGEHRYWTHKGQQGEQESLFCSCECGYYGPSGIALSHDHESEGDDWHMLDKEYHYRDEYCTRTPCHHKYKRKELHTIDWDTYIRPPEYYDDIFHKVYGKCYYCEYEGDMLEEHQPDPFNHCLCPCGHTQHAYDSWHECGEYMWFECSRCGDKSAYTEIGHFFDPNVEGSDAGHWCECGNVFHYHRFDNTTKECTGGSLIQQDGPQADDYPDAGCGYRKPMQGHRCMGKKDPDNPHHDDDDYSKTGLNGTCGGCGKKPRPEPPDNPDGPDRPDPEYPDPYPDPNPDKSKLKAAYYFITCIEVAGTSGSQRQFVAELGGASTFDATITAADAKVGPFLGRCDTMPDGSLLTIKLAYNPEEREIETKAGKSTEIIYSGEEYFNGTLSTDDNGKKYWAW